ncbi:MAG: hypothetical protein NUV77_05075 [Thermoguttaceae bacterium]|nr:hypothetical protein [Thermoguttaceae bacterium]
MRTAFVETLVRLARRDERIWLLTGDLGYSVLEGFAREFPGRFVNAGVAEQNLTGVAAGLALSGKIVFTYSIANFPTLRCLEHLRNDVCHHRANVKVVAVGGGLAYGSQGYTHFGVEDLAVMRAMPYMTVVAPGDPIEARLATEAIAQTDGPCYLRLGKAGEPVVHRTTPAFRLGKAIGLRDGTDATLIATGAALKPAADAAELLDRQGVFVRVLSMPTVKPLDEAAVCAAARETGLVGVVEEHGPIGGLADAVARCLAGHDGAPVCSFCVDTEALLARGEVGSQAYLATQSGLSPEAIRDRVLEELAAHAPARRRVKNAC